MVRGDFTRWSPYISSPAVCKPLEEIYADFDAYTHELFEDNDNLTDCITARVVLPPLRYEGRFVKGILYTMAVDYITDRYPYAKDLFHIIASSMSVSFPWAETADAYLVAYNNPHRIKWYKKRYPHKAGKIYLPFEESDNINENLLAPQPVEKKDIDVLCVSRFENVKNLPVVAKAIQIYRQKYQEPLRLTLIPGCDFDSEFNGLGEHAQWVLQEIRNAVGDNLTEWIDFIPGLLDRHYVLPGYYSRARVLVLGSLMEGKNRTVQEAMACNLPVVCFKDYNRYSRGKDRIFPEGAGLLAPTFDPESLADTLHRALNSLDTFKPRRCFMEHYGRRRFFDRCIQGIPYYTRGLPDYDLTPPHENLWLELAVQDHYQMSLYNALYDETTPFIHAVRLHMLDEMMTFYTERFGLGKFPFLTRLR